ncbi:MAG TPA: hypothetical protein VGS97_27250 [Actinocrinis sp.]|uniref:hypothetical protein n=1 Tax=Actinocrinis sp. TaxID=1920516 RepID=UPI002DDCAC29|nr:hypothetical protein [Actinocrinis sp.]HEV2347816.1 hypothetical protein [Actinocrinis sp.]
MNRKAASPGDVTAWRRSVTALAQELRDCGLGHVYMFIEYDLDPARTGEPSAPIDALLAGTSPGTGEPSYLAVELKQWSSVGAVDGKPSKVRVPQYDKPKAHQRHVTSNCLRHSARAGAHSQKSTPRV